MPQEPEYVKLAFFEGPRNKIKGVSQILGIDSTWMDNRLNARKRKFRITITERDKVTLEKLADANAYWRD